MDAEAVSIAAVAVLFYGLGVLTGPIWQIGGALIGARLHEDNLRRADEMPGPGPGLWLERRD